MSGKNLELAVDETRAGDPSTFVVTVREGGSQTRHEVTMAKSSFERLTGGRATQAQCIDAAFRFLLDREPKESILTKFDVMLIERYFPEFERELPRYLGRATPAA